MARYIDADRIPFYIRDVGDRVSEYDIRKIAFASEIDNIPAADVVEVRHGTWIVCGMFDDFLKCSLCGTDTYPILQVINHKFCPDCGAKMDGEWQSLFCLQI